MLYSSSSDTCKVRTFEAIKLADPVQQRDITLRIHLPEGEGPYPVIIFSHGSLCSVVAYDSLCTYWAEQGYAVIAPWHLDATEQPPSTEPPDLGKLLSSRIRDMSCVLDGLPEISAQLDAPGIFDVDKVAAAGHSFGALTALIKVGLKLQPDQYQFDEPASDKRFIAALNLSGVGPLPVVTDDAFDYLTGPLLVTGGSLDEGNLGVGPVFPWQWRMSAYPLSPAGDKYSLAIENADHYFGGLIARHDRGGEQDPDGLAILQAVSHAFLDTYLQDSETGRNWLSTTDLSALTGERAEYTSK